MTQQNVIGSLPEAAKPGRLRNAHIASLDGLRGMAALYVVIHHAYRFCLGPMESDAAMPRWLAVPLRLFAWGHCAVALFIVLSGFVLMLPVVQSPDHRLRGGIKDYLKRRARRILPPYYASLLLTLLLIAVQPMALWHPDGELNRGTVISHLLMIHNMRFDWPYAINTPMWSVATEWDIYFVFPLLLLPVWRRFGIPAVVAVAAAVSLLPQIGRPFFDWAAPWFILLFTLGMCAAVVSCDLGMTPSRRRHLRIWSGRLIVLLIPLFLACFALRSRIAPKWPVWYRMAADITFALDATSVLVYCVTQPSPSEQARGKRVSPLVKIAQSPTAVLLGRFSYSMYLVHWPVLTLARGWVGRLGFSETAMIAAMMFMTVPTVAIAYGFHLLFERPFMVARKSREAPAQPPLPAEERSSPRVIAAMALDCGSPN